MQTPADRVRLVQEESEQFKHYIHTLPADAWSCPSACDGWEVQDVVAHLACAAEFFAVAIARGLQGDTAPLGGRRLACSATAAQNVRYDRSESPGSAAAGRRPAAGHV